MKRWFLGALAALFLAAVPASATEYMLSGPVIAISGATTASPISITSAAHSYVTGDVVRVSNVEGIPCANGDWIITVTDATHFTLNGSVGVGCGTYSGGAADTVQALGARANGSSAWYDTSGATYVRIYVYGSAAVTGVVTIQGTSSSYAYGTPVNTPAFTLATVTNPTTTGEYWFVTSGRVRVTVSGWSAGTVYGLIEAYGQDGRRIY